MIGERRYLDLQERLHFWDLQAWDGRILFCSCGHPVLVRKLPGDPTEEARFFSTENYAREITFCPGCTRVLSEVDLTPSLPGDV